MAMVAMPRSDGCGDSRWLLTWIISGHWVKYPREALLGPGMVSVRLHDVFSMDSGSLFGILLSGYPGLSRGVKVIIVSGIDTFVCGACC